MEPSLDALQSAHWIAQLGIVFAAGFLSSLTPCVYPLIPVTLALFGVNADISRTQGFALALCYVLGIATTYTTLGIFCAFTGALFGALLGNMWVVLGMCLLLILLSLYTLDVFVLRLGSKLETKCSKIGGKGFLGAFSMGLVSGVIAAPCIGPVLLLSLIHI